MSLRFNVRTRGDNLEKFLRKTKNKNFLPILHRYGEEGVNLLSRATPVDSGLSRTSWDYTITTDNEKFSITWTNDNIKDGIPVVILLQYGHGTRGGTYVDGRDFINPAMKPLFDRLSIDLWKEVISL